MRISAMILFGCLACSVASADTTSDGPGLGAGQSYSGTVTSVTTGAGGYSSITVELDSGAIVTINNDNGHLDANEHGSTLEKAMDHGNDVTLKMGSQSNDLELVTRHRKEVDPQPAPGGGESTPIGD